MSLVYHLKITIIEFQHEPSIHALPVECGHPRTYDTISYMKSRLIDYFTSKSPLRISEWTLTIANLIPLFGVVFFGWSLFGIMFLYWFENIIIGVFNLLKMHRAEMVVDPSALSKNKTYTDEQTSVSRLAFMIFFFCHYGLFTVVHGTFVFIIFGPSDLNPLSFAVGIIPLLISHAISYRTNFIGHEEYRKIPVAILFVSPYARITALHVSMIAGAFMVQTLGTPILALAILIIFKITMDISAHQNEHRKHIPPAHDTSLQAP